MRLTWMGRTLPSRTGMSSGWKANSAFTNRAPAAPPVTPTPDFRKYEGGANDIWLTSEK